MHVWSGGVVMALMNQKNKHNDCKINLQKDSVFTKSGQPQEGGRRLFTYKVISMKNFLDVKLCVYASQAMTL